MVFLSVCRALYDYAPQNDGELAIKEGELLYILEKSEEDDWWKAKKKADGEDEEEPEGLIPNNYVEEAKPVQQAKALYDYSRQTDEELSFSGDTLLLVYDTTDPDWTLVGLDGEFGFAPANYIEDAGDAHETASTPASPPLPTRPPAPPVAVTVEEEDEDDDPPYRPSVPDPARNLASIIGGHAARTPLAAAPTVQSPAEESDEEVTPPPMPQRPASQVASHPLPTREFSPPTPDRRGVVESPPANRVSRSNTTGGDENLAPGGYHLYNVNEMVSVMGKQKKMPMTLGINLGTGVILLIPEKKRDGPQQEWTADKITHYSIESKHVFLELVKPSKSLDLHAGAKDTATEIVGSLGELVGAARAEGLREVIAVATGKGPRKGVMLYDFMAQGDDEVTVADGDEVIILDDTLSEEWWKVRRVKNGKEGVVPSSYVEATGPLSPPPQSDPTTARISDGLSTVERNRREEERLAREALATSRQRDQERDEVELRAAEVGPGLKLPNRGSSLTANEQSGSQRSKRDSRMDGRSSGKSKPDQSKIRTWTDRSGSFKVEAQFIGLKDGKIHLHKVNGVKIAVPVVKMSTVDLEYVEKVTGVSLDEEKPLSDIKKRNSMASDPRSPRGGAGSGQQAPKGPEYDWFDFFLKCGVSPYQCERYSYNFNKDSMDEGVLPEIEPAVLRNLGLKEGDILRVMKYLDAKFGRTGAKSKAVSFGGEQVIGNDEGGESGGLFSGPGGTLRNNTRKGRPAPPVQTNDNIDSKVFDQSNSGNNTMPVPKDRPASPEDTPPKPPAKDHVSGFEDDAWSVKPTKQTSQRTVAASQSSGSASAPGPVPKAASPPPTLTGGMADLSLLSQPLQPTIAHTTSPPPPPSMQSSQPPPAPQQQPQYTAVPITQASPPPQQQMQPPPQQLQQQGANPAFFSQLNPQATGLPPHPQMGGFPQQNQQMAPQPTGFQLNAPRQRPQAPQMSLQGNLMPPPPARPTSAPQNASQPGNFAPPPLQPQLTGAPNMMGNLNQASPPTLNHMQQIQAPPQMPQATGFNQGQGFNQAVNGFGQQNGFGQGLQLQSQPTGFQAPGFSLNSQPTGSPFGNYGMQSQPTGFQQGSGFGAGGMMPQQTGSINSQLPPALQPQSTGINGFGQPGFGQSAPAVPQIPQQYGGQAAPPVPPIPQQPTAAPLQPQKTGPAPNVKFGVQADAKKLMPQATARKANLAHATPDNPFGF